jgi:hypothetical protein
VILFLSLQYFISLSLSLSLSLSVAREGTS